MLAQLRARVSERLQPATAIDATQCKTFTHLLPQALTERGELEALPPPAAAFALRRRAQPSASQPSASSPGPPPPPAAAFAATAASGAPLPLSVTVRGGSLVS